VAGQFHYHFEWDPRKARQNLKRHGVAFDRAATIFLDRSALTEFDEAHSEAEERWITLGWIIQAWCSWSATHFAMTLNRALAFG